MPPTRAKAAEMLKHGTVRGKRLSPGQKRLFGGISHGWRPTRMMKGKARPSTRGLTVANSGHRSTHSDYSKAQRAKRRGGKRFARTYRPGG